VAFLCVATLVVGGCVTIHIHFPTKELEKAAEEIVDEVRPDFDDAAELPVPDVDTPDLDVAPSGESARAVPRDRPWSRPASTWRTAFATPVAFAEPTAQDKAGDKADKKAGETGAKKPPPSKVRLDMASPKIKKVKATLKKRFPKLLPHYQKLTVGEGIDGFLAVRETKGLDRKGLRNLKLVVAAENSDRKNLYAEIATRNKIDKKKLPAIGKLFAIEWQKKCKIGWWIQDAKGKWAKKKPPKKKTGEKKAGEQKAAGKAPDPKG